MVYAKDPRIQGTVYCVGVSVVSENDERDSWVETYGLSAGRGEGPLPPEGLCQTHTEHCRPIFLTPSPHCIGLGIVPSPLDPRKSRKGECPGPSLANQPMDFLYFVLILTLLITYFNFYIFMHMCSKNCSDRPICCPLRLFYI